MVKCPDCTILGVRYSEHTTCISVKAASGTDSNGIRNDDVVVSMVSGVNVSGVLENMVEGTIDKRSSCGINYNDNEMLQF